MTPKGYNIKWINAVCQEVASMKMKMEAFGVPDLNITGKITVRTFFGITRRIEEYPDYDLSAYCSLSNTLINDARQRGGKVGYDTLIYVADRKNPIGTIDSDGIFFYYGGNLYDALAYAIASDPGSKPVPDFNLQDTVQELTTLVKSPDLTREKWCVTLNRIVKANHLSSFNSSGGLNRDLGRVATGTLLGNSDLFDWRGCYS